jgi:hypothetical protein
MVGDAPPAWPLGGGFGARRRQTSFDEVARPSRRERVLDSEPAVSPQAVNERPVSTGFNGCIANVTRAHRAAITDRNRCGAVQDLAISAEGPVLDAVVRGSSVERQV